MYDSDVYNDDLPCYTEVSGKRSLIVPYSFTSDLPQAELAHRQASTIILADACALHEDALNRRRLDFSSQVYERMMKGRAMTGVAYASAMRLREKWCRMMRVVF